MRTVNDTRVLAYNTPSCCAMRAAQRSAAQRSSAAAHTPCADEGAMQAPCRPSMLQLQRICDLRCALYQAQGGSNAAVIAGAGEAAMRIAVAHQIRLDAPPPADVIPIWPQVLLDCHLQPAAFIIHREVELHHALPKCLSTHNGRPASHNSAAGEFLMMACFGKRSVSTLCTAGQAMLIGHNPVISWQGARITCRSTLMSVRLRSGVQGWWAHLWLPLRAPEKTSAALAVPPLTRMTTGLEVSCDGCAENTCEAKGRGSVNRYI